MLLAPDPACFIREGIRMATHVDDELLMAINTARIDGLIHNLEKTVRVSCKRTPNLFLWIQLLWESTSVRLNQSFIIENVAKAHSVDISATTPHITRLNY
jgi:hypothetical protein